MWQMVKLGDVCEILDKFRKPITKKDRITGDYPYYGATGIVDWVNNFIFDERLVLVGEDGAKWEAGDNTAFIANGKYWVNNHAHVLRPNQDIVLHEWIVYYLNAVDLSEYITGLTVPKLNQEKLKSIPIPLPPIAAQQRIVEKLDANFTEIDKALQAIENKETEIDYLKASLLTQYLNANDNQNMVKLGDVCDFVRGPFGASLKKNIFTKSGYAIYEQQHPINNQCNTFRYFISQQKYDEMQRFKVNSGDILMSCSGTIGKTTIVPKNAPLGIINQALLKITPLKKVNVKFLDFFMKSNLFYNQLMNTVDGTAIKNVASVKILKEIQMPLLSLDEQKEILQKLDKAFLHIDTVNDNIKKQKENYYALKSAILTETLQGNAL